MTVTKEQFQEWKNSEITKAVLGSVAATRDQTMIDLAQGHAGESLVNYGKYLGAIDAFNRVVEIEFEDQNNAEEDAT